MSGSIPVADRKDLHAKEEALEEERASQVAIISREEATATCLKNWKTQGST